MWGCWRNWPRLRKTRNSITQFNYYYLSGQSVSSDCEWSPSVILPNEWWRKSRYVQDSGPERSHDQAYIGTNDSSSVNDGAAELMLVGWRELGRECVRAWLMYFWWTGKRYMVTIPVLMMTGWRYTHRWRSDDDSCRYMAKSMQDTNVYFFFCRFPAILQGCLVRRVGECVICNSNWQ